MTGYLTTAGIDRVLKLGASDAALPYIAVGEGVQIFDEALTALADELVRMAVDGVTNVGYMGIVRKYFSDAEAVGNISETGMFSELTGGDLLLYKPFANVTVEKDDARSLLEHIVIVMRNKKGRSQLTAAGIVAAAAGGFNTTTFPYMVFDSGVTMFSEKMDDVKSELARVPVTSVQVSGGTVTVQAYCTSVQAVGTWAAIGLMSAASGGHLLQYKKLTTPYVKGATARVATVEFSASNEA